MKFKDLDDKDKQELGDIIYSKEYDPNYRGSLNNSKINGLCSSCVHYEFAESAFSIVFSYCKNFDIRIKKIEPILECTSYKDRNIMSLDEMKDIAYLIDNTEKKIGF